MSKRIVSWFLVLVTLLSLCTGMAQAANSEEEALGKVKIYNGGDELSYLTVNGTVRKLIYTYFNYKNRNGQEKEIPAYCVNPNTKGVPQTVAMGQSIQYLAKERASDPKVLGIVANGYPTRSLGELKLENKEQAYYATKIALWCYLLPNWDISRVKVNPNLSGVELSRAQKILMATKDIYNSGVRWNKILTPRMTTAADRPIAYPVTVNGQPYKQQIITVTSETWVCNYDIFVAFTDPSVVPDGTKIVDMNNNEISAIKTSDTGNGYAGKFKILYPMTSVEGENGSVQLSLSANVYKYGVYYATCAETSQYGTLQNYMCDTDPTTPIQLAAVSSYAADTTTTQPDTGLKIVKVDAATNEPLSGAVFEVKGPDGDVIGSYSTDYTGQILLPLTKNGTYVVTEVTPPPYYLPSAKPTQTVTVVYNQVATVTFANEAYGDLRIEKVDSSSGAQLEGAQIQIRHIESGATDTGTTGTGGSCQFTSLKPGAYEVREIIAPNGYQLDTQTHTIQVVKGTTTTYTLKNDANPGLRIVKFDAKTLERLPDTSFEVYKDGTLLGIYQTDQLGEITLYDLDPGTYLVKEVSTDSGHVDNSTPQQIELKAGQKEIRELFFFNEVKPGISLIKVDSVTMQPLVNVKFRISMVGGSYSKELTTDSNGRISLTELTPGAYTVKEISVPDGYLKDDDTRIIQIDAGENAQFVFTNTKKPSLTIVKYDAHDNKYLGGATFRIAKIEDGSHYLDRVTDANGCITMDGLKPGVYSVQEIAAPSGYVPDRTEYHVELFPGKISQIIINNEKKPDLLIVKTDAITGKRLPGVSFTVKKADSSTLTTVTTDENGEALLTQLDPGVYQVTEKSVPNGYLLDTTPQLITLVPNKTGVVQFQNYPKPTLTINKVDSITKDPIQGAKFQITYASNHTFTGELNDLGTYCTDENGQIQRTKLKDGWYRVTEVEPAAGYSMKDPATQECYMQAGKGKTLTFENVPLSALVIKKVDTDSGAVLQGAKFRVRYLGGTSGTGGTIIGEYTTSANGTIVVTGLKAGTYIVEETKAPDGYEIDETPQTAYLSGKDQDVVTVEFSNGKHGGLIIQKIDSVTKQPLSGAQFQITTSDGTFVGNYGGTVTSNGIYTTDSNGQIRLVNLKPGTYVVTETKAPAGYVMNSASQTVAVNQNDTQTLTFTNTPKGSLIIRKLDSFTKKPLAGAVFKVTTSSGEFVANAGGAISSNGLYKTDSNGVIPFTGLQPNTYVVTEVTAPDGYILNSTPQTVVVNKNDTQTLTFTNTPIGGGQIIKVDSYSGKRIKGVQFEIAKMNGERIGNYTTDSNGVINLPQLADGWYTATERKAADDYILDTTPHNFEVKAGKTTSLTIENTKASSILIHKIDSVTGKGIYGVTFLVSDRKGNPVGQYTSDQNGYVYIDKELMDGKYLVREMEAADGYLLDPTVRTFYVEYGATSTITWKNTPTMGQIQITKKSADDNPINGLPVGTRLPGATFEIYNRAGNLVDTVVTRSDGVAISGTLPLGRYTIRETKAPTYYSSTAQTVQAEIEFSGQIVRLEVLNQSVYTNVSVTKRGYSQVVPGQIIRYDFKNIANNSTVPLNSFYWRDTLPTDGVRLEKIVTGTWNQRLSYKVMYKTNLQDYRTLADNLSTSKNNVLDASGAALGLASNEYVTEYMLVFGTVKAGFAQVDAPYIFCKVNSWLTNGYQLTNKTDVGGLQNGQWIMATDRWVTTVYSKTTKTLPKTGY